MALPTPTGRKGLFFAPSPGEKVSGTVVRNAARHDIMLHEYLHNGTGHLFDLRQGSLETGLTKARSDGLNFGQ